MACHACFIRIHEAGEHLLLLSNYNLQTARKTNAFLNVILSPPFSEDNLETQQHFQLQKKKTQIVSEKKKKNPDRLFFGKSKTSSLTRCLGSPRVNN